MDLKKPLGPQTGGDGSGSGEDLPRALGLLLALAADFMTTDGSGRLRWDRQRLRERLPGSTELVDLARWENQFLVRLRQGSRLRRWLGRPLPRAVVRFAPYFRILPYPCPRRHWEEVYPDAATLADAVQSQGYHPTADYAAAGGRGREYTRPVAAYDCPVGPFRSQALAIPLQDGRWGLYRQEPEPNPELLAYSAPVWWWPAYVLWWHHELCTFD